MGLDSVDLEKIMRLSVIELYILNYLIRISGSIVRFTVFNEIHDELGFETMSRSSFYNSLKKLEDAGFIEITGGNTDTKDGKTKSIRALPKAKQAINQVNIFNLWGSIDPDEKFAELIKEHRRVFDTLGKKLIVSFQYPANQTIIELMSGVDTYLLGNMDSIGPLAEEYELVSVDGDYIDKRENFFDTTILYRYAYNKLELDISFHNLIDEAIRVTKKGGIVVLLALDDVRGSNNLILESGIGQILEETLNHQSSHLTLSYLKGKTYEKVISIQDQKINDLSFIIIQI